jgi:DNA-binding SARP family transcriptional activator
MWQGTDCGRHCRSGAPLWLAVLGPLEVYSGDEQLGLGPYKQRVLLAALLCRANTVVPVDQLLDVIWRGDQPRTARKNLHVYVSALRKILGDRISHHAYGYRLRASPEELDLLKFDRLAAAGRTAFRTGDPDAARSLLANALRLWRDRALVDLMGNAFIAAESNRLTDRFLAAYENWVDLEIEAGHHLDVLECLSELAARYPFRERLIAATMIALNQGGDRKEALARYESHRQFIARELGLDPSPVLQDLYASILSGDLADAMPPAAAPSDSTVARSCHWPLPVGVGWCYPLDR